MKHAGVYIHTPALPPLSPLAHTSVEPLLPSRPRLLGFLEEVVGDVPLSAFVHLEEFTAHEEERAPPGRPQIDVVFAVDVGQDRSHLVHGNDTETTWKRQGNEYRKRTKRLDMREFADGRQHAFMTLRVWQVRGTGYV